MAGHLVQQTAALWAASKVDQWVDSKAESWAGHWADWWAARRAALTAALKAVLMGANLAASWVDSTAGKTANLTAAQKVAKWAERKVEHLEPKLVVLRAVMSVELLADLKGHCWAVLLAEQKVGRWELHLVALSVVVRAVHWVEMTVE